MYLLEAKSLKKSYDGVIALNNGSLCCEEGRVCGLLGANGSGKTTFSKIVSGIIKPSGGEILLDGKTVHIRSTLDAKRFGIAMVHQNLSLISELTVWENINLGHEVKNPLGFFNDRISLEKAANVVEKLCPGLSLKEKVKDLAPAQKQLVEIAKALSQEPRLLILDEPTSSLEHTQVEKLFSIIEELKSKKVSIIFISHRLWEITRICDFAVIFRNGETVGTIDFGQEGKDEKLVVSMITGKENNSFFQSCRNKEISSEKLLEIEDLSVKGKVRDINLTLHKGEIIGLSGLQGQGQEELLLALSGLMPSEGKVSIEGKRITLKHPRNAIKKGMVLVPGDRQKEGLFLYHNIFSNLIYPKFCLRKTGFFLKFKKLKNECDQTIESISINPPDKSKVVSYLSGGNQQKVVVGKWLPLSPRILLMSDPAKGVDVEAKAELYNVVSRLAEKGTGVIIYASDNEELIDICDRVMILFEGKIAEEIHSAELCEERLVASSLRTRYEVGTLTMNDNSVTVGGKPL